MTKISWLQSNNTYKKVEGDFSTVESVPVGIYNIGIGLSGWYLEKYADKFTFDYKMYGLQTEFCEHVLKTYKNTKGNFGIMLTGTKGTGKTVTAKTLANAFNLPVIIVKDMGDTNQAMIEFLGGFNFDCVLFFDEFEKNFSEKDSTILQIMDGVYSSEYRKIFLLTTNEMTINENMVGRPSRIRYVKKFENLDIKTVEEYLDDALVVPEAREDIIEFIDSLSISTIDILKTIVNEVNIHGANSLEKCKSFFNVNRLNYDYRCIKAFMDYDTVSSYPDKYTVDAFVKDVEKFRNRYTLIPPKFLGEIPQSKWTEEQRKEYKKYLELRENLFRDMQYDSVTSDKRFDHLKQGDEFEEDEIILVDKKKNVIVTKDMYNAIHWYYILNPNEKPSLYSKSTNLSNLIY